jgi:hypothetical protein
MSPLLTNHADGTALPAESASLAPVFTPHGRLALIQADDGALLEVATARRLRDASRAARATACCNSVPAKWRLRYLPSWRTGMTSRRGM